MKKNKTNMEKNSTINILTLSIALVVVALNVITIARINAVVDYSNGKALEHAHAEYKLRKEVFCLKHGLTDCFDQDIRDWNKKQKNPDERFEVLSGQDVTDRVQMLR